METKDIDNYERLLQDVPCQKSGAWALGNDESALGAWQTENQSFIDSQTLKSLFFSEDWVYILVDLIAMKISRQHLKIFSTVLENGEKIAKAYEYHPLLDLFEQPNEHQAYNAWMYCTAVDLVLLGNAIQWKSSGMLMCVPAETILLDLDREGKISSYKTTDYSSGGEAVGNSATKFPAEQIIHMRKPNPSSMLWGLSPFVAGRKQLQFNRYSQDYLNSFYQKGAMTGFALEMDKEANERVAMRLLKSFENAYTGRANMRRTLILPKGVNLKEVTHSLASQELSTYINLNRETILNLLKVPKHELSLQESGSLGSQETRYALKNFWQATLLPMMGIIESELTKFFLKSGDLSKDQWIEFDTSNIESLQDDEEQKAGLSEALLKTHTLNEVREKLYSLPPLPDGDSVAGFGGGSFAMFDDQPEQVKIMHSTSEEFKTPEQTLKLDKNKVRVWLKSKEDELEKIQKEIKESIKEGVQSFEKKILTIFSDYAIDAVKISASYVRQRTKASDRDLKRRLRKAFDKYKDTYISGAADSLTNVMETGYSASLGFGFNLPDKQSIEALKESRKQLRNKDLGSRASQAFQYLDNKSVNDVFKIIGNGLDRQEPPKEIAEHLRNHFSDVDEIGARAMTIARTETMIASSMGKNAMMQDAAEVVPNLKKMWQSALDDRVRDSHQELDSIVKNHDEPFDNNLMYPRDPRGSAEEVINCRCDLIIMDGEQIDEIEAIPDSQFAEMGSEL